MTVRHCNMRLATYFLSPKMLCKLITIDYLSKNNACKISLDRCNEFNYRATSSHIHGLFVNTIIITLAKKHAIKFMQMYKD